MPKKEVTSARQRRTASMVSKRQSVAKSTKSGYNETSQDQVVLAELTTKARKRLKTSQFAIPGKRAYPIEDKSHAQNALARVSQFGTPEEKAKVRAAVARKYPQMGKGKKMMKTTKGGK